MRRCVSSGTPWEEAVGYSRAMRVGNQIFVSGTTASNEHGQVKCVNDAYGQTKLILEKIETVLEELGGDLRDVTRTRLYVTDINRWAEIGQAHCEFFGEIRPCATMVEVSRLVNPGHLVEIEADAVLNSEY